MNKCILCTFFKMIWQGLRDNTCPSIDKKKEEKKTPTLKIVREYFFAIVFGIILTFLLWGVGYLILWVIALLLNVTIGTILSWLGIFIFLPVGLIVLVILIVEFAKIRIACIKAYWRKAKEECE